MSKHLARAAAGGAVAPSPSSPPEAQCAAPGGPHPVAPNGVNGAGAFPRGGVHRRRGRRAVGGDRVRRSAAATLDACRALLADHLSYGDRWGNPPAGA
ncbi:unnamed protein product [Pleuronectes platessa]|uniref:Uncharacterized protein n=1 Tax=Pleuronectes platessa TaxID=8262 RepID=A0A9N7VB16_PLEPL|nr:unnamed protein product [Pleuronectes platessa]